MQIRAKKTEFQSQSYTCFWPTVMISERAMEKAKALGILYPGFDRAVRQQITYVLEQMRAGTHSTNGINTLELVPEDSMPRGIKMSYTVRDDAMMVCDFWTPLQPQLFA